jgi:hypothetical protein
MSLCAIAATSPLVRFQRGTAGPVMRLACAVLAASSMGGCQGADSESTPFVCPDDLPAACPSPPPSWSGQVQAIVDQSCGPCHLAGGVEQSVFDFSSYSGVSRSQGSMLVQVNACAMPPADAGPLSAIDRTALLGWLVCKAPEN